MYLRQVLLKGHKVQVGDVDHVQAAHYGQLTALNLPHQVTHVLQLPQLSLLGNGVKALHEDYSVIYKLQTTVTQNIGTFFFGSALRRSKRSQPINILILYSDLKSFFNYYFANKKDKAIANETVSLI